MMVKSCDALIFYMFTTAQS